MPVARGVFLGVICLCVCYVGDLVWFRACALAPAPACGLVAHTEVGHRFVSTSPDKSSIRFASHKSGNLAGKTEKRGTVRAFGNAGGVDTICIPLMRDIDPTAKKLYLLDHSCLCRLSNASVRSTYVTLRFGL